MTEFSDASNIQREEQNKMGTSSWILAVLFSFGFILGKLPNKVLFLQYQKPWSGQVPDHPSQVPDHPSQVPDQGGQEPETFFVKI